MAVASQGQHVVRLKSGDPSVFGRASEEIAAARAHGIEVEIIPGVTAASLCAPFAERGRTDRIVLATATCQPGKEMSDLQDMARPGTTLVSYMAMKQLSQPSMKPAAARVSLDHPMTIATRVLPANARTLQTTLAAMAHDCGAAGIRNPAVVILHLENASPVRPAGFCADTAAVTGSLYPA